MKQNSHSLDNLRRNDLARSAPRREAVEHHQTGLFQRRVKLGLVLEIVHALLRHGGGKLSPMAEEGLVEGLLDAGGRREPVESCACEDCALEECGGGGHSRPFFKSVRTRLRRWMEVCCKKFRNAAGRCL